MTPTPHLDGSDTGAISLSGAMTLKLMGTSNDAVVSASSMTYGGTLFVTNLPGNTLVAGDTFILFQGTCLALPKNPI